MKSNYDPDKGYEFWLEQVQQQELEFARKQIAEGASVDLVMEAMSARIVQKAMHPLYKLINEMKIK